MPQQTRHAASCTVGIGPAPGMGLGGGPMAANRAVWLEPRLGGGGVGEGLPERKISVPSTAREHVAVPRMGVALASTTEGTRGGSELGGGRGVGTREKGSSPCAHPTPGVPPTFLGCLRPFLQGSVSQTGVGGAADTPRKGIRQSPGRGRGRPGVGQCLLLGWASVSRLLVGVLSRWTRAG